MVAMADCVQAMLVKEGIEKAVIAGHSMGGYVGFAFAASYPGMVAGLSLVHSTPVADDEGKKNIRRKAIDIIRNGGKNAFIRQMVANLFAPAFKQSYAAAVEKITEHCIKMKEESLINFYNAMILRPDSQQMMRDIKFPVQWILGSEDQVMPYVKNVTNCYLSSVNFVELYDGIGHMSMVESPVRLSHSLTQFAGYCFGSGKVE